MKEETPMRKKLLAIVFAAALLVALAVPVFGGAGNALAHVHPTVPANECAATADGPGNEAAPQNSPTADPPLPGLILDNTPSAVDGTADGPGVGPATDHCANDQ